MQNSNWGCFVSQISLISLDSYLCRFLLTTRIPDMCACQPKEASAQVNLFATNGAPVDGAVEVCSAPLSLGAEGERANKCCNLTSSSVTTCCPCVRGGSLCHFACCELKSSLSCFQRRVRTDEALGDAACTVYDGGGSLEGDAGKMTQFAHVD